MTLRDKIKAHLDRETVAEILSFIGIDITRDFKFKDNTSFSIARNGLIKDFGSTGFCGDILDFIMLEKGVSFPEALEFIAACLGVEDVA